MPDALTVRTETEGPVSIITIDRPASRNAVNAPTALALAKAFRRFDADVTQHVAILTGAGGHFCAGYDLKQTATGHRGHRVETGDGPMGPTRLELGKPVIAAIEGAAVAGGLELALWCDLRSDRRSTIEQWSLDWDQATLNEYRHGIATVATGETEAGARRFAAGQGRHGSPA